ncbi:MAG: hypothetical protein GYA50_06175 [Eubacteriaceae bacterium]|nr:hypothetical protein [Eubacteriaceae bacterium]
MAIEYNLLIQGEELTNKVLFEIMHQIGLDVDAPVDLKRGIEINQFFDKIGIVFYLTNSNKTFNESGFKTLDIFKFDKCLGFRFDKLFEDYDLQWKTMMIIIFSVMNRLKTNAIFAYEFDTLYSFFSKSGELFVNTQTEIDKDPDFLQLSAGWIVKDIEKNTVEF